jgi:hypothetical protein
MRLLLFQDFMTILSAWTFRLCWYVAPFEIELHTTLVCSLCILQSEQHFHIAKTAEGGDERGGGLVCLSEGYLVIT